MKSCQSGVVSVPELDELIRTTKPRSVPWTENDESVMRQYYGKVSAKELAKYLGRRLSAVTNKARYMGLQRGLNVNAEAQLRRDSDVS